MTTVFFGIHTLKYRYDRTLGRGEFSGSGFRSAMDMALGPEGRIYVVNRGWEHRPDSTRVTMMTFDEDYLGQFGECGTADGLFTWPTSIALDSGGNVYVSDELLNRISIFDKDGAFLAKWGVEGAGDGELDRPAGIRLDKDDNLYVVDSRNHRVQKFTKDGKFLAKWGENGAGDGQFNLPWGLTIDSNGDVYVADWRNDRVQKFTADGQFLAKFGTSGSRAGEFNRPAAVAVDGDGDIYVADWFNDRVQALTPEGRHITTFTGDGELSKWGQDKLASSPDMLHQLSLMRDLTPFKSIWRPRSVEIDSEGRILILDGNRARIQVYCKEKY